MKIELSDEALEFGRQAQRALGAAGGDELVQAAERDPAGREQLVAPVLAELGAWDLEPRRSDDELEAAAALCRSAGSWAVPYPVAERLCRPPDLDVGGLVVVADRSPVGPVAGLDHAWAAVTVDGRRHTATAVATGRPARATAFVAPLELQAVEGKASTADVALGLVLPCWTLLGMLDRALELTRRYVLDRQQFGQPLARFQGVQFQLTDAEVERSGVEELARYALWSIEADRPEMVDDALALRLAAVEAAQTVFRITHQLHGAIGFCDETTLSWISRYSEPLRAHPFGLAGTLDHLVGRTRQRGLVGLFDGEGARRIP